MGGQAVANTPSREQILADVTELLPTLRARAQAAEQARRVPDASIEALGEAFLWDMTRPRRFGGIEADLELQSDVITRIARACPSTAWVTTLYTGAIWTVGLFHDDAQDEVFAAPGARVTSVFAPTGTARRNGGGYVVNGRWAFSTGCLHGDWAEVAVLVEQEGAPPAPYLMLVPYGELTIEDTWFAMGLAATGSNTIVAQDVVVPEHRVLSMETVMGGGCASERNRDIPYYRAPVVPFLLAQSAATPVGIAQGAFDMYMERIHTRAITYTDYAVQAEAAVTHLEVAEAAMLIATAEDHMLRARRVVESHEDGELPLLERARLRAHVGFATSAARDAVQLLFAGSGASAIQQAVDLQRQHRDMQAMAQHGFLAPSSSLELFGRVQCGLPPNSMIL